MRSLALLRALVLLSLVLPLAAQAQNPQPETALALPGWSSWKPYIRPAAPDTTAWHSTADEVRQLGLVPPARWLSVDPLAEKHPDWTPYNYVLANPLYYIDPDGRQEAAVSNWVNNTYVYPITKRGNRQEVIQNIHDLKPLSYFSGGVMLATMGILGAKAAPGLLAWTAQNPVAATVAVKEGFDFVVGATTGIPDPEGFGGGTLGQGARRLTGDALQDAAEELFEQGFKVGDDVIEILAEVAVEGKTLHLKDIAVFPRGAEKADIGKEGVFAIRKQLTQLAKDAGFEQLRITGVRTSGAKKGKEVDIIIDLLQEQ